MGRNEDAAEELVKACIHQALGVEVRRVDCNSGHRVADFEVDGADGTPVPIEVTTAVDEAITQATEDKGFEPWNSKALSLSWTLTCIVPPPKWKTIRKGVEMPLKELERLGVPMFDTQDLLSLQLRAQWAGEDAQAHANAVELLARLGLQRGFSFERKAPPNTLAVGIPGESTWDGTAKAVPPWAGTFVNDTERSDNLEKMGTGGHYAIVMDATLAGYTIFRIVEDLDDEGLVPIEPPDVPDVVRALWLFTMTGTGKGLHWSREGDWLRVPPLRASDV